MPVHQHQCVCVSVHMHNMLVHVSASILEKKGSNDGKKLVGER